MLSSQEGPGHLVVHISATIYLQPLHKGLMLGDGLYLNVPEDRFYETK